MYQCQFYILQFSQNCRCWLNWYSSSPSTVRIFWIRLRNILTENILNRSEKSSNHSRIQFKTMIISGEMFGKIWYDPRCLVRYPSHKIPLSTDTREMVKAGNMWRKVMLSASEEGETRTKHLWRGTHEPSSCKQRERHTNRKQRSLSASMDAYICISYLYCFRIIKSRHFGLM